MITEPRERFTREYGCTPAEWRRWMPEATQGLPLRWEGDAALQVALARGTLGLRWEPLPPRAIALLRLPRLQVAFAFDGVGLEARLAFLKGFDLHLQRGGG